MIAYDASWVAVLFGLLLRLGSVVRRVVHDVEVLFLIEHAEIFIFKVVLEVCLIVLITLISVPIHIAYMILRTKEWLTCFSHQSLVIYGHVIWLCRELSRMFSFPLQTRILWRNHQEFIRFPFLLPVVRYLLFLSFKILPSLPFSFYLSVPPQLFFPGFLHIFFLLYLLIFIYLLFLILKMPPSFEFQLPLQSPLFFHMLSFLLYFLNLLLNFVFFVLGNHTLQSFFLIEGDLRAVHEWLVLSRMQGVVKSGLSIYILIVLRSNANGCLISVLGEFVSRD